MQGARWLFRLFPVVLALGGCATMDGQVRERAARDFSCRQERLHIVDAEGPVFRVAGCGSIATYQCEEHVLAMRCRRASWDAPDAQVVSTASGRYTLTRRSLVDAEREQNGR
jgi:hypothetical protein